MAVNGANSVHPKEWVKGNAVGSGSFGIVNLAMNKSNGKLFVVKSAPSGNGVQALANEACILEKLDSPYIVQCLGHDFSEEANGDKKFNLFMEFMAGGSLSDISEKFGGALDESVVRLYTKVILQGLTYLHKNQIVHCDLKCKNVLLDSSGNVKLADFGCAKKLNSANADKKGSLDSRSLLGTPLWMAPEVLRNEGLSFALDIWSLGCTVIEMATGTPPWAEGISDPMAAIYKIACGDEIPAFPTKFSDEGVDFLSKCLQRDPELRWSSEELLNHPFILKKSVEMCMEEETYSPLSILDLRDWDSDGSDGSDSPTWEVKAERIPFSKPTRKLQRRDSIFAQSEEWVDVRSS